MGKNLIQQARGKGGPRYRAPSFRYLGSTCHRPLAEGTVEAEIVDIVKCQGHLAPLMHLKYTDGVHTLQQAPTGVKVGDKIKHGPEAELQQGNTLTLEKIPDGTLIFNIESTPGDGGKFCRTSGTFAKITGRQNRVVTILLPSRKTRKFHENCRAMLGIVAGAGRTEKPFLKAGKKHLHMKARNKRYPESHAHAQNAVDHPFGNKRSSRKAKNKPVGKNAPAGRKVGSLWPRRTGQRK